MEEYYCLGKIRRSIHMILSGGKFGQSGIHYDMLGGVTPATPRNGSWKLLLFTSERQVVSIFTRLTAEVGG